MEVKLGIRIREDGVHVYGDGRQALLERIERLGSINAAKGGGAILTDEARQLMTAYLPA